MRYRDPAITEATTAHRRHGEAGQSLVVTTVAMVLVIGMLAFGVDLAAWYQRHHQAQVAADAAALAAANCMATAKSASQCTSQTDTGDAENVATTIAADNGITLTAPTQVTVNTTSDTVTVTTESRPPVDFAGFLNVTPVVSARSVASWTAASVPDSIFAGNPSCTSGSGLQITSNGGGNATVSGLYSDGVIDNSDNSGSANYAGGIYANTGIPVCGLVGASGSANVWSSKNTVVVPGAELPYPQQYTEPTIGSSTITTTEPSSAPPVTPGTCTFAATYFSTNATGINQIRWPGVYCVIPATGSSTIASSYVGNCTPGSADDTAGSIFINSALSGAYEFVGPCVVGDGYLSSSVEALNSANPLIYGTAQLLSPCLSGDGTVNGLAVASSPDNVYLANNNLLLNSTIYAPCGTVELAGNSNYAAFIEAANVIVDKNNFSSFTGTGPVTAPATDTLTG